jgi:hypothetical protein
MISELASDLVAKLNAIPALAGRVGLHLGGTQVDPGLSKATLPLAWPIFRSMKPTDPVTHQVPTRQSMQCSFAVFVLVDYKSQADLASNQYPLLEETVTAIRGSTSPAGTGWRLEDFEVRQINVDRLYYELRFSINTHL